MKKHILPVLITALVSGTFVRAEILEQVQAVSADQVRNAFAQMLAVPASVAIAGKVDKAAKDRCLELFAAGAAAGEVRIDTVP